MPLIRRLGSVVAAACLVGAAACSDSDEAPEPDDATAEAETPELELSDEFDEEAAPEGCPGELADLDLASDTSVSSRVSYSGRLADPDGDDVVQIIDGPISSEPEWSADGSRAVVDSDGLTIIELDGDGDGDGDGDATLDPLDVEDGSFPTIDRSGTTVGFVRDGHAWARAIEGGDEVDLGPTEGEGPAWSSDGQYVAVDRGESVYIVAAAGGDRTTVPYDRDGEAGNPSWSPVDDVLAYNDGGGISVIGLDGSPRRPIVRSGETGFTSDPEWSPDGRHLSFIWTALGDGFEATVCVASVDGGVPADLGLVLGPSGESAPVWSPDGRFVLAHRSGLNDDGAPRALLAVDVRTGQSREISGSQEGRWVAVDIPTDPACAVLDTWVVGVEGYLDDLSPFDPTVGSVLGRASRVLTAPDGSGALELAQALISSVEPQLRELADVDFTSTAGVLAELEGLTGTDVESVVQGLDATTTTAGACGVDVLRRSDDLPPPPPTTLPPPTPEGELLAWSLRYSVTVYDIAEPIGTGLVPAITGEHAQPPDGSGPDWPAVRESCAEAAAALPDHEAEVANTPTLAESLRPLVEALAAEYRTFIEGCIAAAAVEDFDQLSTIQESADRIGRLNERIQAEIEELVGN